MSIYEINAHHNEIDLVNPLEHLDQFREKSFQERLGLDPKEKTAIAQLMEGYENNRDLMVAINLVVGLCHGVFRENGDPESTHAIATVINLKKYNLPIRDHIAMLTHDLPEDKEVEKKHYIALFGKDLGTYIWESNERLSKIRKSQTQTEVEKIQTLMKMVYNIVYHPGDAVKKVGGDKPHNMVTIDGKPWADQVTTAADALEFFMPVAEILGLHDEVRILADTSYEVLDKAAYGMDSDYVPKLRNGIEQFLRPVDHDLLEKEVVSKTRDLGILEAVVDEPGVFEISKGMNTRREISQRDFFLNLNVILDDKSIQETRETKVRGKRGVIFKRKLSFEDRVNETILRIISSDHFSTLFDPDTGKPISIGIGEMIGKQKEQRQPGYKGETADFYDFHIDYITPMGSKVPIKLRIYSKKAYDLEHTPLTYLDSLGLSDMDKRFRRKITTGYRRQLAREKLSLIKRRFNRLRREVKYDDVEFIRRIVTTLPDSVLVTQLSKGLKEKRIPRPRGATIIDHLIATFPDRWQTIKSVEINGVPLNNNEMAYVLKNGDRIRCKFRKDNANMVRVDMLDNVRPENRDQVAKQLENRKNELLAQNSEESNLKANHLIGAIRDRGWRIINAKVPHLGDWGMEDYNNEKARDLAYRIGLGRATPAEIEEISYYLNKKFNESDVMVFKLPNEPNWSASVLSKFGEAGINIMHHYTVTKWMDSARLIVIVDDNDKHFINLDKILPEIREMIVVGSNSRVTEDEAELRFNDYHEFVTNWGQRAMMYDDYVPGPEK